MELTANAVSPSDCPLCGQPNQCAMEQAKISGQPLQPCWCTAVDFSAALLERIPANARNLACVCSDCARSGSQ